MIRLAFLLAVLAAPATAAPVARTVTGGFDEVAAALEDAIIGAGLVIEGRSHVGDMLARTKADVGGQKDLYLHGDVFTFCSAVVSRTVMERDPLNIQFCPYSMFVYEAADAPGQIVIGHEDYAAQGVPEVAEMMAPILAEAAGE